MLTLKSGCFLLLKSDSSTQDFSLFCIDIVVQLVLTNTLKPEDTAGIGWRMERERSVLRLTF